MNSQSITRTFWRYSIPAIAALMISGLYMVVDGIFIGHAMGATGLSAINMAWPLSGLMLAIGMMIGMGGGAQCSLAQGAAQWPEARSYLAQAIWLLVLLGIPTGVLVVLAGPAFMAMQGAENNLAQLGNDYLRVIGWAAPLVFGSIALPLLVRNLGAPRLATLAMLMGALTNVALDYLFIIVWQWGLHGAALATVIGESLSVLICLGFICSRHNPLQMPLAACTLNLRKSLDVLTTGFSSMLMYLYMSLVVVLHNLLFMHYGSPLQVAAYAIAGLASADGRATILMPHPERTPRTVENTAISPKQSPGLSTSSRWPCFLTRASPSITKQMASPRSPSFMITVPARVRLKREKREAGRAGRGHRTSKRKTPRRP